jgi:hypothetical protein
MSRKRFSAEQIPKAPGGAPAAEACFRCAPVSLCSGSFDKRRSKLERGVLIVQKAVHKLADGQLSRVNSGWLSAGEKVIFLLEQQR